MGFSDGALANRYKNAHNSIIFLNVFRDFPNAKSGELKKSVDLDLLLEILPRTVPTNAKTACITPRWELWYYHLSRWLPPQVGTVTVG